MEPDGFEIQTLGISEIIILGRYLEDGLSYQSLGKKKITKICYLYYSDELTTMSVSYFQN